LQHFARVLHRPRREVAWRAGRSVHWSATRSDGLNRPHQIPAEIARAARVPSEENPSSEGQQPGPGTWCLHGEPSSPILPSTFWVPVSMLLDSYVGLQYTIRLMLQKGDFRSFRSRTEDLRG
jgi:hypothetical protein